MSPLLFTERQHHLVATLLGQGTQPSSHPPHPSGRKRACGPGSQCSVRTQLSQSRL